MDEKKYMPPYDTANLIEVPFKFGFKQLIPVLIVTLTAFIPVSLLYGVTFSGYMKSALALTNDTLFTGIGDEANVLYPMAGEIARFFGVLLLGSLFNMILNAVLAGNALKLIYGSSKNGLDYVLSLIKSCWGRMAGLFFTIGGIGVAFIIVCYIALGITGLVFGGLFGSAGAGLAAMMSVLVLIAAIAAGIAFLTYIDLAGVVIAVEGSSVFESIKRSINLIKGNFWRYFGIRLLLLFIIGVALTIVSFIIMHFTTQPGYSQLLTQAIEKDMLVTEQLYVLYERPLVIFGFAVSYLIGIVGNKLVYPAFQAAFYADLTHSLEEQKNVVP